MKYLMIILAATCVAFESGAAVCGGCKTKSNPGANYCYNCGKKLPSPSTLEEQYEALMRRVMPTLLAMEQTPEKDVSVKMEELIRTEMAKFRTMSPSRQKQEYDNAKTAMEQILQSAKKGAAVQAQPGSQAGASVGSSEMAMMGRNLFVGIIQANTEREVAGLDNVWPKSQESKSDDKEDISGMVFKSSTDYFRVLFDLVNVNTKNWSPYVAGVDWTTAIPKGSANSQWIVVKGITDDMTDNIPVVVSSNVDVKSLISTPGDYDGRKLEGSLQFSGDWAVIIYKGGGSTVLKRKYASLANVYQKQCFSIPRGFGYLNP